MYCVCLLTVYVIFCVEDLATTAVEASGIWRKKEEITTIEIMIIKKLESITNSKRRMMSLHKATADLQ